MPVARVAHVLLLRFVASNMDVNTLASKRSELIGNAAIVRKCRVIHKKSTCVCLWQVVSSSCSDLRGNAGTQGRPVAGFKVTFLQSHMAPIGDLNSEVPLDLQIDTQNE